jgi:hypothetical protein
MTYFELKELADLRNYFSSTECVAQEVNGQPTFGITSSQKCWQYVWEMANVKMDH